MKQSLIWKFPHNFIYQLVVLLAFVHISRDSFSQCDFTSLGPSDEHQASYGYSANLSSVSFENKTFICYKDKASRIFVRQWDGVAWATVGNGPVSSSTIAMDPHIAVNKAGKLYVVYREVYNASHIAVRMWDGGTWKVLGDTWLIDENWGSSTNMVNRLAISIDPDSNVYVASFDQPSGEKLTVMKWDGASWGFVGSRGFSTGFVADIQIAFDQAGIPYVGFVQAFQGISGNIMKFDGTGWVTVGTESLPLFEEYAIYLANDKNGDIYFAHKTVEPGWGIFVKKLVDGSWVTVGGNIETGSSDLMSLSIDDLGALYLTYSDRRARPGKAAVKKWQGDSWIALDLGLTVESRAAINVNSFVADGKMRFVYAELSGEAIVLEWDGARWDELISRGLSNGVAGHPSTAIDMRGVPYIFYLDFENSLRGIVQKWNGSTWIVVGDAIQANNPIYDPYIVLDEGDTPYIAFTDYLHDFKLSVMKLVDNQWQMVGTQNFSSGQAGQPSITFSEGIPYVAYADKSLGWKIIVKKWDGSNWETVGPEGISDRGGDSPQLAFDQNHNPVLAYLDRYGYNIGQVVVKKWDGSNWQNVGIGVISEGYASVPAIVTCPSGAIYVSYYGIKDLGEDLVVQKWDGNQWTVLGSSGISEGPASSIRLNLDTGGAPLVTFLDSGRDNQLVVERWDGGTWNTVSQWNISSHYIDSPSLVFDRTGTPFIAYSNGDIFARMGKSALVEGQGAQTINISKSTSGAFSKNCELIALVKSVGAAPVEGNMTAAVWVESKETKDFVGRHYEITPTSNAAGSTGRVTLYFTQEDFDTYNAFNSVKLPTSTHDVRGVANVLIEKRSGTSSDGTGLPSSYSGAPIIIDPIDSDIFWNVMTSRWEVSFDVTGFSGFFVKTATSPLPVRLLTFNGSQQEDKTLLTWRTAYEADASLFEIECSFNAKHFKTVGIVRAFGNSESVQTYSFLDDQLKGKTGMIYYRLRMIDVDSSFSYSRTIAVNMSRDNEVITVYPNPIANGSQIFMKSKSNINQVSLFDLSGKSFFLRKLERTGEGNKVTVDDLPAGNYVLKMESDDGVITNNIMIK